MKNITTRLTEEEILILARLGVSLFCKESSLLANLFEYTQQLEYSNSIYETKNLVERLLNKDFVRLFNFGVSLSYYIDNDDDLKIIAPVLKRLLKYNYQENFISISLKKQR